MKKVFIAILSIVLILAVLGGAGFAIYKYVVPLVKGDSASQECEHVEGRTSILSVPYVYTVIPGDDFSRIPLEKFDCTTAALFVDFLTVDDVSYTFYMLRKKDDLGFLFLDENTNILYDYSWTIYERDYYKFLGLSFTLGDVEIYGLRLVGESGPQYTYNIYYTLPSGQCALCGEAINSEG